MTTLRDLSYVIEANTQGLNQAYPALEKLVNGLERLEKSIQSLSTVFEGKMGKVGAAAKQQADIVTKSTQQVQASVEKSTVAIARAQSKQAKEAAKSADQMRLHLDKVSATMHAAQQRVTSLNSAFQSAGADNKFIQENVKAYEELRKVLENTKTSAGEAAIAKQKFNAALVSSKKAVDNFTEEQRQNLSVEKAMEAAMEKVAASAKKQAAEASRSADKAKAATDRYAAALVSLQQKMIDLNTSIKKVGGDDKLIASNVRAFEQLEDALSNSATTAGEATLAKAKFNAAMSESKRELATYAVVQKQVDSASARSDSLMLKQENTVERLRLRYLELRNTLEGQGARSERIEALTRAFEQFEARMRGGVLNAREFSKATNELNSEISRVKRNEGFTSISSKMSDLASSAQVALGPLSGVASRITAITSLANRNNIAVAGVVGAFIAFATSMARAVQLGAQFERQMGSINAVLQATSNRIGMSAAEVEEAVQRVASATLATESEIRDAAASLLTFSGVTKDLYENALLAAQGLALIARGDINSQIRNMGRVLQDPMNNLTALSEAGVEFNAVEEERIRLLQMSGKIDEARAAVMERVTTVVAAATGETGGLLGAWKNLTDTFNNFLREAATGSNTIGALTAIVNDLADRLKSLNENTVFAEKLMLGYRLAADTLGIAIKLLADNVDYLIGFFVLLAGLKVASLFYSAFKAIRMLNQGMKMTIVLQQLLAGGWKGVAMAIATIAGVELYEKWLRDADAAAELTDRVNGLDDALGNVQGSEQYVSRLRTAMTKISTEANKAMLNGQKPTIDLSIVDEALKMVNAGHIKEAAEYLEGFLGIEEKVVNQTKRLSVELEHAAQQWVILKNEHFALLTEQEKMQAQLTNLTDNWDRMREVLMQSGDSAESAEAKLRLLRTEIELNGSSVNQFVNNLEKSIAMQERDLQAAGALGGAKHKLRSEQAVLNALWSSGLVKASNFKDALIELRTAGFGPLVDQVSQLQQKLEDLSLGTQMQEMRTELQQNIALMQEEVSLIAASDRERAAGLELARTKVDMLNAGIEQGSEFWKQQLELVRQLSELDFTKQHLEALKAMQGQAVEQDAIASSLFYSERTRKNMLDLAMKEFELSQKYGSLLDERAQKELGLFKILQKRDELLEQWEDVANVVDNAFQSLEDSIVEAAQTGEFNFRKLANAILADILRLNLKAIFKPVQDQIGKMMAQFTGFKGADVSFPAAGQLFGGLGTLANPAWVRVWGVDGLTGGQGIPGITDVLNGETFHGAPLGDVIRAPLPDVGATGGKGGIVDQFLSGMDKLEESFGKVAEKGDRLLDPFTKRINEAFDIQGAIDSVDFSKSAASLDGATSRVLDAHKSLEKGTQIFSSELTSAGNSLGKAVDSFDKVLTPGGREVIPGLGLANLTGQKDVVGEVGKITKAFEGKIRDLDVSPEFMSKLETALSKTGDKIGAVLTSGGQMPLQDAIAAGATKVGKKWFLDGEAVRTGSTRHDVGSSGLSDTADLILTRNGVPVLPGQDPALYQKFFQNAGASGFTGMGHYPWGAHVGGGPVAGWGPSTGSGSLDPNFGAAMERGWAGQFTSPAASTSIMGGAGTEALGGGGGLDQLTASVTKATDSLNSLGTTTADTVGSLSGSFDSMKTSVDSLATTSLPKVTSGMDTLATDTITKNVAASATTTAATTQQGVSSTVASAQIQQLGNSATIAGAQVASAGASAQGGGFLSKIGSFFGFAAGGYTGTGATKDVAGVVHNREFVFDAAATSRIGVDTLERIRSEATSGSSLGEFKKGRKAKSNSSSDAGFATARSTMEERLKIVNVMNPEIVGDYLQTDEGEKIVMNVLRRNGYA